MNITGLSVALLFAGFISLPLGASNITVSVNVLAPVCTINNGQRIDIDFGEKLGVGKIDGDNYRQKINYLITCSADAPATGLTLTVMGTAMTSDYSAVQSSISGLGIRLLENNRRLRIGQAIPIDAANPPLLEAVPVADPAIKLAEGSFVATAEIIADYD